MRNAAKSAGVLGLYRGYIGMKKLAMESDFKRGMSSTKALKLMLPLTVVAARHSRLHLKPSPRDQTTSTNAIMPEC